MSRVVGQIIGGSYGEILIRQKAGEQIEIGDLLVSGSTILQVFDLEYGSLIEDRDLAMMSGMSMEGLGETRVFEEEIRNFVVARAKPLLTLSGEPTVPKTLPPFFGTLRRLEEKDLHFLSRPEYALYLGKVRSGSRVLNVPVYINGKEALTHHILIPATTGRGKSNLVKVILYHLLPASYAGVLVLDPHDEYYGRHGLGLKDHPQAREKLLYYSVDPPTGGRALWINIRVLRPWHFRGAVELSQAQEDACYLAYQLYGDQWIEKLLAQQEDSSLPNVRYDTISALKRKLGLVLGLEVQRGRIIERGRVFRLTGGEGTVDEILDALENGKTVIVDTSPLPENTELFLSSLIAHGIFQRYRRYKEEGILAQKPVVGIVIEEAPRVLGDREEPTVFATIAREGRKFQIGLIAVTQLASMIPREILANMNTKIILGNEMSTEREAIIRSAAQDLSKDSKMIASLDKGEAIVSSIFTRFAIPIRIDLFEELVRKNKAEPRPVRRALRG